MRLNDLFFALSLLTLGAHGFNLSRHDNVGVYWGQDAQGANNPNDTADYQKTLSYYCKDNSTDIIPIAFLDKYFSTGGLPEINLGNTCSNNSNSTFPGTALTNCSGLAWDIKYCQKRGKRITLSIGGALGNSTLNDTNAREFAENVWNLFLGGWSETRPFGDAVLDGIDLDIENGSPTGYATFVNKIRSLASGSEKKYYITAAPQCPFPDATLGSVLNSTSFDAVFVQFYNNPCGLQNFNDPSFWNFGIWDNWARNISANKHVKVFIAALGGPSNVGNTGYVPAETLGEIAVQMRESYPSFGGVMLWDASQASANGNYTEYMKKTLSDAGGVGFDYPACWAYGYVDGQVYTAGQNVSYEGYIWEAKWWTDTEPTHDSLGPWGEVSACIGVPPVQPPPVQSSVQPSPSPSVVSGTPLAGSVTNGGKGRFERAYFRNMGSGIQAFLGFLTLAAAMSII